MGPGRGGRAAKGGGLLWGAGVPSGGHSQSPLNLATANPKRPATIEAQTQEQDNEIANSLLTVSETTTDNG